MKLKALYLSTVILLSGCATIVSKSEYNVSIQSVPANYNFEVVDMDGVVVHQGTTPQKVSLAAGSGYFQKAEYTVNYMVNNQVVNSTKIQARLDGWYIGNIIFGGLIGWLIVDPLTGAMYALPESVTVEMADELNISSDNNGLHLMDMEQLPEQYVHQLIAINH